MNLKSGRIFWKAIPVLMTLGSAAAQAQLAIYEFTKVSGVPSPNVTQQPVGVTYSPFQRVNLVAETSGPHVWDSSNWASTTYNDNSRYVGFTVTTYAGTSATLTDISFIVKRESSNGPKQAAMELFLDNVSQGYFDYSPTKLPGETVTWNFADISFGGGSVAEFRFYGWNATEGSPGHLSFDNVSGGGTALVPEFSTGSMVILAGILGAAGSGLRSFVRRAKMSSVTA